MDILIQATASDYYARQDSAVLKTNSKRLIIVLVFLYIVGLAGLIVGISTYSSFSTSVYMNKTINITNWHLFESVGFVITVSATCLLVVYLKNLSRLRKKSKSLGRAYLKTNNKLTIQLNDQFVLYKTSEISIEVKWLYFSSYSLAGDFILLNIPDNGLTYIGIDKTLLAPSDLSLFMNFLNKRHVYKP